LAFDAFLVTNSGARGPITVRALTEEERRCGGLSNGIDGKGGNEWGKVVQGTRSLKALLDDRMSGEVEETEIVNGLFEILACVPIIPPSIFSHFLTRNGFFSHSLSWRSPEPVLKPSDLQNTILAEPIQIKPKTASDGDPDLYGTRLSTVLLIRRAGQVLFIERDVYRLDDDREPTIRDPPADRVFRFTLDFDRTTHA
jgi:uncharacterized protein with NRDE domain